MHGLNSQITTMIKTIILLAAFFSLVVIICRNLVLLLVLAALVTCIWAVWRCHQSHR